MKIIFLLFLSSLLLIGDQPLNNATVYRPVATCRGEAPCKACSTCNYCKYCNSGGSCGICRKSKPVTKTKQPDPTAGQCKATTKKGTRCKRNASKGGYCWQHEKTKEC